MRAWRNSLFQMEVLSVHFWAMLCLCLMILIKALEATDIACFRDVSIPALLFVAEYVGKQVGFLIQLNTFLSSNISAFPIHPSIIHVKTENQIIIHL